MGAATDAYVQEKTVSLFVSLIDEGGTMERFAFGCPLHLVAHLPPHLVGAAEVRVPEPSGLAPQAPPRPVAAVAPGSTAPAGNGAAGEAEARELVAETTEI